MDYLATRLAVAGEMAICLCAVPFFIYWLVGWPGKKMSQMTYFLCLSGTLSLNSVSLM